MVLHEKKRQVAPHFNYLDLRQCNQHHVVSIPVPMVSHDQEIHLASHFDHLYLRSAMAWLMLSGSCDGNGRSSGITWPKKPCCTSFWLFWPSKMNGAIGDAIMNQVTLVPMALHDKKCHNAPHFIVLIWEIQEFHWWCHQHYVMLTLAPMASHDRESPITPQFNCLDLRNAMMPFIMVFALYAVGANDVTWPKETYAYHFTCLPKENSDVIYGAISIIWCWYWSQWHHLTPTPLTTNDANASGKCVTWPKMSFIRLLSLFKYILDESGSAGNKEELLFSHDKLSLASMLRPLHQVTKEMLV